MLKKDVIRIIKGNEVYIEGTKTLKSGISSDHFYDFSRVFDSQSLPPLAMWLVSHATDSFNVIFTSAYKGIPLASAMLCECGICFPTDTIRMGFLRKEEKDHGEGGVVVGYTPNEEDIVLLVDDVLTSGQSLREMAQFVEKTGAVIEGAVVIVNRMTDDDFKKLESDLGFRIHYLVKDEDVLMAIRESKTDVAK